MDKLPPELKEKIKKETKALLADEGKFKKIFEGFPLIKFQEEKMKLKENNYQIL